MQQLVFTISSYCQIWTCHAELHCIQKGSWLVGFLLLLFLNIQFLHITLFLILYTQDILVLLGRGREVDHRDASEEQQTQWEGSMWKNLTDVL